MTDESRPSIKIVKATTEDVGQLLDLVKILGYETDEASLTERLASISTKADHCLLVAKNEEHVIGFCHGYIRLLVEVKEAIEIGGMVVAEEWQGKGVAKTLVQEIEKWATSKGINWMVLSSNVFRTKAHGFYEHMGYKKVRQQFAFEKYLD